MAGQPSRDCGPLGRWKGRGSQDAQSFGHTGAQRGKNRELTGSRSFDRADGAPPDGPQACADLRVDARYVCKMELLLLQTLQWRVTNATSASFVCYLLRRLRLPVAERRRRIREHALDILRRIIEGEDAELLEPRQSRSAADTFPPRPTVRRAVIPPATALSARCGSSQNRCAPGRVGGGGSRGRQTALGGPRRSHRCQGAPFATTSDA